MVAAALLVAVGVVWFAVRGNGSGSASSANPASGGQSERRPEEQGGEAAESPDSGDTDQDGRSDPSSRPEQADRLQARAVDSLLTDSGGSRSGLGPALNRLRSCSGTADGLAAVRRVTEARREQVTQLKALPVDALDGGAAVKGKLAAALTASRDADEAFLRWATRQDGDCRTDWSGDQDYRNGLSHSGRATDAKRGFLELWNPLAERYGLPRRAEHEI